MDAASAARPGSSESQAPFLPLSFRFFVCFGLLVVHVALPTEGGDGLVGQPFYLAALALGFLEAALESARGCLRGDALFPTPGLPAIRWNLGLDLALVAVVVAFQGLSQERFSALFAFPALASAFYLRPREVVWTGLFSVLTYLLLVVGFLLGWLPTFGNSGAFVEVDLAREPFVHSLPALEVLATTVVAVFLRRRVERLQSDLRVTEAAVDTLSALHERVVESMSSGLITLDPTGRVTSCNPAAASILGRAVPAGLSLRELLPLPTALPAPGQMGDRFEVPLSVAGEARTLGGQFSALRGAGPGAVGHLFLFQDLTALKALEARTRLSEQLAATGQLAAGLAHELGNPLASISGCAQLLRHPGAAAPERVLGILERETRRVDALLAAFLASARAEAPGGGRTFLPDALEDVRASWETDPRAQGLPLTLEAAPPVWIDADPSAFHPFLLNLLSNARKALEGRRDPHVHLTVCEDEEGLQLAVADNGCGMSRTQVDRLSLPFVGSFREGSGLGMTLAYQFAARRGWQLQVESREGVGTVVRVRVPRSASSPALFPPAD